MSHGLLQRWRASTRSSIAETPQALRRTFRFTDIKRGWCVEDCEEMALGTVEQSGDTILTVSRGFLSSTLYLPPSVVSEVHEGLVRLNVTSGWVAAQGWDRRGGRLER